MNRSSKTTDLESILIPVTPVLSPEIDNPQACSNSGQVHSALSFGLLVLNLFYSHLAIEMHDVIRTHMLNGYRKLVLSERIRQQLLSLIISLVSSACTIFGSRDSNNHCILKLTA